MAEQEIIDALKADVKSGYVQKRNANKGKELYNKYNEEQCTYCMCNARQRMMWANKFIDWFESRD